MSWFTENPALVGFIAILVFTAFQAGMTWLGRRHFRNVADLSDELLADPKCDPEDRAWIRAALDNALDRQVIFLAPFAPLLVVLLVGAVICEEIVQRGVRFRRHPAFEPRGEPQNIDELAAEAKELQERLDAAAARTYSQAAGIDVTKGHLWNDPRRKRMLSYALDAQRYRAPISWTWTAFWLVLAVLAASALSALVGAPVALIRRVAAPLQQQTTRLVNAFHLQGRVL